MNRSLLLALVIIFQFCKSNDIRIENLKLYVNCEEFYMKAMCYNPVPLGVVNNGGFCSLRLTPFNEYKTACYDSDYFDGSLAEPARDPPGPTTGWFTALWERDFPAIKELGVNTLRLYNANPTTRAASIEGLGKGGIMHPVGKDHVPFMDMAEKYGFKVIFPLMGDFTILENSTPETVEQYLRNQIDEVGNHSALIMWNFSNELPLDRPEVVQKLNYFMNFIRKYQMEKWNRFVPITVAIVDNPHMYNTLVPGLNVDIFSSNAGYRGVDFQDLWSGDRTPGFSGFANLSRQYNKPLFVAEIGWHTNNNAIDADIPNWFNQIYKDLVAHTDEGCVGGAYFEWSDEPHTKSDILQQTMGVVLYEPAVENGKNSTEPNAWVADTLVKKSRYETLKSGTVDGIPYNFNADVFKLIGRPQSKLDASKCSTRPSYSTSTDTPYPTGTSTFTSTTSDSTTTTSTNDTQTTISTSDSQTIDSTSVTDTPTQTKTSGETQPIIEKDNSEFFNTLGGAQITVISVIAALLVAIIIGGTISIIRWRRRRASINLP